MKTVAASVPTMNSTGRGAMVSILGQRGQRRLKSQFAALAQSGQAFGEQFFTELRNWVAGRTAGSDEMATTLQLNLAVAATCTAYQTWATDESFDGYLRRLEHCLHQTACGVGPAKTSA